MSSSMEYAGLFSVPVASLQYHDISLGPLRVEEHSTARDHREPQREPQKFAEVEMSEAEFSARIRQERMEAALHAEQKIRQEYERKLATAQAGVADAIGGFAQARDDYFAQVESEVVQLSLSIAAKILHREAQVDPLLVAALVRIAVEKMRENSNVTVHVGSGRGAAWKQYCGEVASMIKVQVVEDSELSDHDCLLETELGIANFGLDTQLKEVEQGFFDLLALRPANR